LLAALAIASSQVCQVDGPNARPAGVIASGEVVIQKIGTEREMARARRPVFFVSSPELPGLTPHSRW
jgi:hypothetical protein